MVVYDKNPTKYLQSVREANGLDRVIRAIEKYSPWLEDGMSVLAIDAPEGGGVTASTSIQRMKCSPFEGSSKTISGKRPYLAAGSPRSDE
jgi:hypothetical protein